MSPPFVVPEGMIAANNCQMVISLHGGSAAAGTLQKSGKMQEIMKPDQRSAHLYTRREENQLAGADHRAIMTDRGDV